MFLCHCVHICKSCPNTSNVLTLLGAIFCCHFSIAFSSFCDFSYNFSKFLKIKVSLIYPLLYFHYYILLIMHSCMVNFFLVFLCDDIIGKGHAWHEFYLDVPLELPQPLQICNGLNITYFDSLLYRKLKFKL